MNFTEEDYYSGSASESFSSLGSGSASESFSSLGSDPFFKSENQNHDGPNRALEIFGLVLLMCILIGCGSLILGFCSLIYQDCIKECIKDCFKKSRNRTHSNSSFDIDSYGRYDSDYDVEVCQQPPRVNTIVLEETSWDTISIQSTEMVCAICCENLEEFDKVVKLNCNHIYHQDCINKWVKEKNLDPSCPMCREYII